MLTALDQYNLEKVKVMIANGFPVDTRLDERDHSTALMHAAHCGMPDIVQVLLDAGARVDLTDANGNTALHWSVSIDLSGDPPCERCINILLTSGCAVDARNQLGSTALGRMITDGHAGAHIHKTLDHHDAVEALLDGGADPALLREEEVALLRNPMEGFLDPATIARLLSHVEAKMLDGTTLNTTRAAPGRRI